MKGERALRALLDGGDERALRAALCRLEEPDERPSTASAAVALLGPHDTLRRLLDPAAAGHRALRECLAPRLERLDVVRDLDRGAARGARFLIPGDAEWPELALLGVARPPYGLWVRGAAHLAATVERSVAIVGSRASTEYGETVAGELAAGLGLRGWSVVSGGAFGIDAAAHRGALAVATPTVAVLASGVDVPYPLAHTSLFERIVAEGALVSELPPGDQPRRLRFLARNRLVSGLSRGVVVVEAGLRSGTRTTARQAVHQQRVLMVVPGPVTSWASRGCHELLRDARVGAVLVCDAAQVVEAVGRIGEDLAPELFEPAQPRDQVSRTCRQVLDALPVARSASLPSLVDQAALPRALVQQALAELCAAGLAHGSPHEGYRLAPR